MSYARKSGMLAAAGLLGVAALAAAQGGPGMGWGREPDGMFSALDFDKDGFISVTEHRKWAGEVFAKMDANKDMLLSREESLAVHMGPGPGPGQNQERMAAMRQKADARKAEEFSKMDSDKNGLVTHEQFLDHADSNFAAQDANKDGKVSANEFRNWHHR
jgi:hypothetical protein